MSITFISALTSESGGGGGGTGVSLIVTCDAKLAGNDITITNGTVTYTEKCPSAAPYVIEIPGIPTGTWTASTVYEGDTITGDSTPVIADYNVSISPIEPIRNTSYETAYGSVNALVSKGSANYLGTGAHVDGSGGLYNKYYTTNSNIANLAISSMTSDYMSATVSIVANKFTYNNNSDKTTYNFLVDGYAVVSVGPCNTGLTMNAMRGYGNVFSFIPVKAGDKISTPIGTPDNESAFVSFYEKL